MALRVVLDTNQVVAAGTGWLDRGRPSPDPNTSRRVLIKVAEAHIGLYCGKIVGEYLEKLVDLEHPRDRALKLITYLMGAFERVTITTRSAPYPPSDPDDEIFLLCALDGNADHLVSDDGGLLALKRLYAKPSIGNCTEVAGQLGA
jgi:predicted nucleic acid-binding protein